MRGFHIEVGFDAGCVKQLPVESLLLSAPGSTFRNIGAWLQEFQEFPDRAVCFQGVSQFMAQVQMIDVTAAQLFNGRNSSLHQFGENSLHGPFSDADLEGDLTCRGLG